MKLEANLDQIRNEIKDLEKQIEAVLKKIEQQENIIRRLEKEIQEIEYKIGSQQGSVQIILNKMDQKEGLLSRLNQEYKYEKGIFKNDRDKLILKQDELYAITSKLVDEQNRLETVRSELKNQLGLNVPNIVDQITLDLIKNVQTSECKFNDLKKEEEQLQWNFKFQKKKYEILEQKIKEEARKSETTKKEIDDLRTKLVKENNFLKQLNNQKRQKGLNKLGVNNIIRELKAITPSLTRKEVVAREALRKAEEEARKKKDDWEKDQDRDHKPGGSEWSMGMSM